MTCRCREIAGGQIEMTNHSLVVQGTEVAETVRDTLLQKKRPIN